MCLIRRQKWFRLDINPEEIGRNRTIDLPIVSDAKGFLMECNRIINEKGLSDTLKKSVRTMDRHCRKGP